MQWGNSRAKFFLESAGLVVDSCFDQSLASGFLRATVLPNKSGHYFTKTLDRFGRIEVRLSRRFGISLRAHEFSIVGEMLPFKRARRSRIFGPLRI